MTGTATAASERSVGVGATALRYRVQGGGGGEPLVLLHPWFGCVAFWDEVAERITGRPVIVADLYSLGEGDWRGVHGPPGIAAAVGALLDAEGIERCALAGNSTGGVAAQLFAIEHPERVARLILIGTGASTAGIPPGYRAEIEAWLADDPDGSRSAALVRRLLARDPEPARMAAFVAAVAGANREYMARTLEGVLALDLRARLGAIAAPTLIIRGTLDAARTPEHVETLLAGIAGSRAVEIPGAGHSPMVDSPDALVGLMADFLDERPDR